MHKNILILLAALSSFLIGGLWYSPLLFLKIWTKEKASGPILGKHPTRVFGISFLFSLVAAIGLYYILGPKPSLSESLKTSGIIGFCFVTTSFGMNYQFANKSTILWLIDAGYHCVQFLVMGLIFGL